MPTLIGIVRWIPTATNQALVKVFTSMTEQQLESELSRCNRVGLSLRESVGLVAYHAGRIDDFTLSPEEPVDEWDDTTIVDPLDSTECQ